MFGCTSQKLMTQQEKPATKKAAPLVQIHTAPTAPSGGRQPVYIRAQVSLRGAASFDVSYMLGPVRL
jgi:hypothetical protein